MLFECADDNCEKKCRVERKGSKPPTKCVDDAHDVRMKRVTMFEEPIIKKVFPVTKHDSAEIPQGWTVFQCLQHTDTIYVTQFIDAGLTQRDWQCLLDKWYHENELSVLKWVYLSELF